MKIAVIGHKRVPSREGGIEVVVEQLAVRMAAQGHIVQVYNRRGRHVAGRHASAPRLKEYKGVRLFHIPTINVKGLDAFFYSLFATLRALFGKYDILHYHAEGPSAMLPLARLFGKRTLCTIHGLDWQRAKWGGFATKYLRFGEKMAAKHAGSLVVLSANMQRYFKETYNRDSVLIPNGVEAPQPVGCNVIAEKWGLKPEKYILFLSRLVPEKGLDYLLEAYGQLDTDIPLVIAGGASHSSEYVEQIKQKGARDARVVFTGFVEGQALYELFANCLVYVLPSDVEGMPLSLLEAMSYGRRCLVSDIPENTQVVQEYGTVFAKGNIEDLHNKLAMLLREQPNPAQALAISSYVLKQYSWDNITSQYLAIMEEEIN